MWPFRSKHPFPLSRLTPKGRANRKEVLKQLNAWRFVSLATAPRDYAVPFAVQVGKEVHSLRLENFYKPPRESDYDWHADLVKSEYGSTPSQDSLYLVGRVRFSLLDDKITNIAITHLAARKVIRGP